MEKSKLVNEKYKAGLKEMLKLIHMEAFVGKKFIKSNGFPSVITIAAVDLFFIKPIALKGRKVIYSANYKPEEVTDDMSERLRIRTNLLLAQQKEQRTKTVEKPIEQKVNETVKVREIDLGIDEIVAYAHEGAKLKEPFYLVDSDTVKFKPLSDWSDEHLLMELANRGYMGKLERITGNNLFETVETITLNKR